MEENNKKQKEESEESNSIPIEGIENSGTQKEKLMIESDTTEAELKSALEKVATLEKQNAELKDTLLRKVADFENFKRRNENDQLNIIKYAAEPFIRSVLQVYDDLERSLAHIDEPNNADSTKKGLLMVFEKFGKILDSQGVKRIDAKGQPFDVNLHEALMQQPAEGVAPHTVLEVIEPGYIYKDRVIRHAKVVVSAETTSHDETSDGTDTQNDSKKED
ncbi:MAG: nucleotide exchange factor GrpE [Bacteroidota bacterium]